MNRKTTGFILVLGLGLLTGVSARADEPESPAFKTWFSSDYLLWTIKAAPLPNPLVTTGDPSDPVSPGAIGRPGTQSLYGGQQNMGLFSGTRASLGTWLGGESVWGVEASAFYLFQNQRTFSTASDVNGNPPVYVPVYRSDLGREGAFTISDPVAALAGNLSVTSTSQLWGAELNVLNNQIYYFFNENSAVVLDVLAGARYMNLSERLTLNSDLSSTVLNNSSVQEDSFRTQNQFFGGQMGVRLMVHNTWGFISLIGKTALGDTHQSVTVDGSTTQSGAGALPSPGTFAGSILTAPSNIGQQSHDAFTFVPQAQLKVGVAVFRGMIVYAGYDVLYWSSVVRPGLEIDHNANPTQLFNGTLTGPATPAPQFNRSDFWAQGVSFGMEFHF